MTTDMSEMTIEQWYEVSRDYYRTIPTYVLRYKRDMLVERLEQHEKRLDLPLFLRESFLCSLTWLNAEIARRIAAGWEWK